MILHIHKNNEPQDIFTTALCLMLDSGGDGDCVIMSEKPKELASQFVLWLKLKKNYPSITEDYFTIS